MLLKDVEIYCNNWLFGCIIVMFFGKDNLVCKVEVCVSKDGKIIFYVRLVMEFILLLEN